MIVAGLEAPYHAWRKATRSHPYLDDVRNMPELRTRLTWLSEGSLAHHMTMFCGDSCNKEEIEQFRKIAADIARPVKPKRRRK